MQPQPTPGSHCCCAHKNEEANCDASSCGHCHHHANCGHLSERVVCGHHTGAGSPHSATTPNLSSIWSTVAQYEPPSRTGAASLVDLCACLALAACDSPGTGLPQAFGVLDCDNGRKDGKLSLSETKRLLCAMLCIMQEAHGVDSVPLVAPVDVVCSRLALSCFTNTKVDASSGEGITYASFVSWFATVRSDAVTTVDKLFNVMTLFVKTVPRFHPLPAMDACHDPNASIDNRALRLLQRVHYTQFVPLFHNGMQYLTSIAREKYGPISGDTESDECISLSSFRAWLVWLVTLGPSGGVEQFAVPFTAASRPENAEPAAVQATASAGALVADIPPPVTVHAASPLYPTLCDDKCCKHCNRKAALKNRLLTKLEARKHGVNHDILPLDGDTVDLKEYQRADSMDTLLSFIEGSEGDSSATASAKKKKNRKKKKNDKSAASLPGSGTTSGTEDAGVVTPIAPAPVVVVSGAVETLDAIFDESKFEEDPELDEEVEQFRRRLGLV